MTKQQIISQLHNNHNAFVQMIDGLSITDFMFAPSEKWTAGQQLEHIYRAVSPVTLAFTLPRFIVSWKFGKSNRPSRTYDALVERYHTKLASGGSASGRFIPPVVQVEQKKKIIGNLLKTLEKLAQKVERSTEEELDTYILPHPLLGKLTLREMLYFTIYHVQHHHNLVLKYLAPKQ